MLDPLAQAFRVDVAGGYSGIFVTKLDLYFQAKSLRNNGVTVYICEMENGYPNTTKILPLSTAYLPAISINTSSTAQTASTFIFEGPVYLANKREYCFVIKPDGNDPDYKLWIAELGGTDTISDTQIYTPPLASTLFYSYTYSTWTAVQTQYVKFDLYRADFTNTSGTITLTNKNTDFFNVANVAFANASVGVRPGDKVYSATNNNPTSVNTSISGTLIFSNLSGGTLSIGNSTGNFANASGNTRFIQIHRSVTGNSLVANSTTLIATANLVSIFDITTDALVPRIGEIQPPGTRINYKFFGTSNSFSIDSIAKSVQNETETELIDYPRVVMSYSNERFRSLSGKSLTLKLDLETDSGYTSPVIDLTRAKSLSISNKINSTTANVFNEQYNSGNALSKYISKPIVLASDQDAEDLKVYVTAYRPAGTDVLIYAKFLSASDSDGLTNKNWTLLTNDSSNLRSNPKDVNDVKEFTFSLPSSNALPTTAYYNSSGKVLKVGSSGSALASVSNNSANVLGNTSLFTTEFRVGDSFKIDSLPDIKRVVYIANNQFMTVDSPFSATVNEDGYYLITGNGLTYSDAGGATYVSFKTFAIKAVLLADSTSLIPRISDIRAIALQI